jgi:hypothetical protein
MDLYQFNILDVLQKNEVIIFSLLFQILQVVCLREGRDLVVIPKAQHFRSAILWEEELNLCYLMDSRTRFHFNSRVSSAPLLHSSMVGLKIYSIVGG